MDQDMVRETTAAGDQIKDVKGDDKYDLTQWIFIVIGIIGSLIMIMCCLVVKIYCMLRRKKEESY